MKMARLRKILASYERVLVAYSGGLDSTFLLKAAVDALGRGQVLAVTARSATYPPREYRDARRYARLIGSRHMTIRTDELAIAGFKENPVDRCYYCKRDLFERLWKIAKREGIVQVIDGTNADDLRDVRYGRRAARELGVRSPLVDAGFGKADIRNASRRLGLASWAKPPAACLASRFPSGTTITPAGLRRVALAEEAVRRLGPRQVRVRVHGPVARIEVSGNDGAVVMRHRRAIAARLRAIGFVYVALDLNGYRTGSLHEAA